MLAWHWHAEPVHARILYACARTAALGADRSSYKVDVAVVYIAQTNGLVKKAIERGASSHPLFISLPSSRGCLPDGRSACHRVRHGHGVSKYRFSMQICQCRTPPALPHIISCQ